MEYEWRHITSAEFDQRRENIEVAFFPIGACEIYGPHLPLGSDGIVAQYIAETMAKRVKGIVLPLLPVGCSKPLDDFPGTLSVSSRTLYNYAKDIIESAMKWGIRKIFFVQGHLINVAVMDELAFDLKETHKDIKLAQIDVWRYLKANSADVAEDKFSVKFGHAGEVGTSVLMYVCRELVLPPKDQANEFTIEMKHPDINSYLKFCDVSDNGCLGNPIKATYEKGEILVNRLLDKITDFVKDWN